MKDRLCTTFERIYAETQDFYADLEPDLPDVARRGYSLLWATPVPGPAILFIGFQPGGREPHIQPWPPVDNQLVASKDPMPTRIGEVFGPDLVARSNMTNAIFIRSPGTQEYKREVSRELRARIAKFCLPRVRQLVDAMAPQEVVLIGFETLKLLGRDEGAAGVLLPGEGKRTLVARADNFWPGATAVTHLTATVGLTSAELARARAYYEARFRHLLA